MLGEMGESLGNGKNEGGVFLFGKWYACISPSLFFSISLCTNVCVCTSQAKNDTEKSQNRKKLKLPSSSLHRYIAAALLLMAVAHKVILISIGHR